MDTFVPHKCNPKWISCAAKNLVDSTLWAACNVLEEHRDGFFLYKQPKIMQPPDDIDSEEPEIIKWITIDNFMLGEGMSQIGAFIRSWDLSPATKFVLEPRSEKDIPGHGKQVFVDALFSKPTHRCPNPLAIAMVHFVMHVSKLLPVYYPIMVTYRFEGYKSVFYALGDRCIRSLTFQRFFIDTILHMKLSFYAKICECIHDEDGEKVMDRQARRWLLEDYDTRSIATNSSR